MNEINNSLILPPLLKRIVTIKKASTALKDIKEIYLTTNSNNIPVIKYNTKSKPDKFYSVSLKTNLWEIPSLAFPIMHYGFMITQGYNLINLDNVNEWICLSPKGEVYQLREDNYTCTCPDFIFHKEQDPSNISIYRPCKHLYMLEGYRKWSNKNKEIRKNFLDKINKKS